MHGLCTLPFVVLFFFTFSFFKLVYSLLEPFIVLDPQEVVTLVQDPRRRVDLLDEALKVLLAVSISAMLDKVAQDAFAVRVFKVQDVVLHLIELVWSNVSKLEFKPLFLPVLPSCLLLLFNLLINLAFFALDSLQSLVLFLFR